jgi:hypothetical protein
MNDIAALYDLDASVSITSKTLFDRLNLGSFVVTELKFHLAESTYKQVVGIKDNIAVQIKVCLRIPSTYHSWSDIIKNRQDFD